MHLSPRRTALTVALVAALSLGTAGAAVAGPKVPQPKPAAKVVKVLPQVTLRVTPVSSTPQTTDHTAVVTVKAPKTVVTGTYRVLDGGVLVASGTLVQGSARAAVELAPGTHRLTAVYSGAAKVNGASTKVVVVPVPAPPVEEPVEEPAAEPAEG